MKVFLIIMFALISAIGCSENYYVSNDGNDSNPGNSPQSAWATIGRVNSQPFQPGDKVLFNRGGSWYGQLIPVSGSPSGHVTYGAYGLGSKPLLHQSAELGNAGDWVKVRSNTWSSVNTLPYDVGSIIFNDGQSFGSKKWSQGDLASQGDFYYDTSDNKAKVYSASNPASYYSGVRLALTKHIIEEQNRNYIIYENLALKYTGAHAIRGGNTHHIIVRGCDIAYIGGGHHGSGQNRFGNGVEFWGDASDNLVEDCKIWEVYDAALTNQSTTSCVQKNIIYRNNIIWDCEYSFEFFNYPTSSTTENIQFINNTCLDAGYGWGHSQRPDPSGRHVCIWQIPSNAEGIIIENNIFYRAKESPLYLASGGLSPMTINYNDWYQDNDGQVIFELPADIYTKGQFEQYKGGSGLDANSIIDDPLLSGYNLTKDSPCIDAGNPESPLDSDGTIADIGALYFNQQGAALESTEEHITINEGDNYQGWTTTGQYQRVLASTSGADSVVVTILTVDHKVGNDDRNPLKPFNVVVFPNPADNNVTVQFSGIPAKGTQIELLDINGRIVFRKVAVSTYERINIESQLPGTYFVRTTFGKNHIVDTLIIR